MNAPLRGGTDLPQRVQREAMGNGPGSEATRLLDELTALPGIGAPCLSCR